MTDKEIKDIFGNFEYETNTNGSITILGGWTKTHVRKIHIGRWTVWCHALLIPQLQGIYKELKRFGLEHLFDLRNGGGCFVPRHKSWKKTRGLSLHSWGVAVDINPKKYPYGSKTKPHPALIQAFEKYGFEWGGWWRTSDPMHFEWSKFV